ncbi:MAG: malate dehydrogenase (quinone) [Luteolibacter sp.]
MNRVNTFAEPDVVLIGGGIMSATLGVLLHQLDPTLKIQIVEALAEVARESSNPWNNAGTGHAALCELNYTHERPDGSVDISKALEINDAFEVSKQFWAYLVREGILPDPAGFITPVPHMSFVSGRENQEYLARRHAAMTAHHFFEDMVFTTDRKTIAGWTPLMLEGRSPDEPVAATHADGGTDVNFGSLTEALVAYLESKENIRLATHHPVQNIKRLKDGRWKLTVRNLEKKIDRTITTRFVFVGAGGASLPLLQKSGIPEGKGFGGFPVSGQFLVCSDEKLAHRHEAKVYGKAAVGAPPMSVPHLDTRIIDGKRSLLFGPFAGFSPKFLKTGSLFDLPGSVRLSNLVPMLAVGKDNMDLTRYLIEQVMQSPQDRLDALREFFPNASLDDWQLFTAGQRVQIIKQDPQKGGVLQFGTEVVSAEDGSIAALLGASPGASTAVDVMLHILGKCFATRLPEWQGKLRKMIPSYGHKLVDEPGLYRKIRSDADTTLGLTTGEHRMAG